MKYIVEHLEESVHPWCVLEYTHMIAELQPSEVIFTNIKLATSPPQFPTSPCATFTPEPVGQYMQSYRIPAHKVCLLDMNADLELSHADTTEFEFLLFGGILGNGYHSEDRTRLLRSMNLPRRHLGPVQMTTDTAVIASRMILDFKLSLDQLLFVDCPTIQFSRFESMELPYRYLNAHAYSEIMCRGSEVTNFKESTLNKAREPKLAPGMFQLLKQDFESDMFSLNA